MNNAIKLAREKGGYRRHQIGLAFEKDLRGEYAILWDDEGNRTGTLTFEQIILDPLFWVALGKALEWSNYTIPTADMPKPYAKGNIQTWLYHAQRYFYLVLTGGDVEKFWKELLG